jgi:hypothetical protein
VIFGTGGQAAEIVAQFEAAGVDRIYLQWLDLADFEGLAATVDVMCG